MSNDKKLDVIYILSEKSSGSSFLFRSLQDALSLKDYPKTHHFESETLYWTKAASLLKRPQIKMLGSVIPYDEERARCEIKTFLEQNLTVPLVYETDEEMVFNGWYELIKEFGPVFIEKSPHHLLQWSALELMAEFNRLFKDKVNCHYVCIVRNPKDVFLSQFRRWNIDFRMLENQWLMTYMNWTRFVKNDLLSKSKILVRYEDLTGDKDNTIYQICNSIGVKFKLKGREAVRKSKSSNKSEFFGYAFSNSVIYLAETMGYSKHELQHKHSVRWLIYEIFMRYMYGPAKKIYNLIRRG
jgi:hypothetical protein